MRITATLLFLVDVPVSDERGKFMYEKDRKYSVDFDEACTLAKPGVTMPESVTIHGNPPAGVSADKLLEELNALVVPPPPPVVEPEPVVEPVVAVEPAPAPTPGRSDEE